MKLEFRPGGQDWLRLIRAAGHRLGNSRLPAVPAMSAPATATETGREGGG